MLHTSDSIERYKEKGPFEVTNVKESAEHTTFLLNELSGRFAEDIRANVFFGKMSNKNLPDTQANQVRGKDVVLTRPGSKVKVVAVTTNEELVIATDTMNLVRK